MAADGKIENLQAMRAVAALLVVASHVRHKVQVFMPETAGWFAWFDVGLYGVDIFFVISGFIIATVSAGEPATGRATVNFMGRRFIRILPLYWLASLLSLAVWLYNPMLVNSSAPELTRIPESFLLIPQDGRYLIQSGWTLVYEMYFYLLFAATLLLGGGQRVVLPAVLAGGVAAGVWLAPPGPESAWLPMVTSRHLAEFLAGYLFATYGRRVTGSSLKAGLALVAAGVALVAARLSGATGMAALLYDYGIAAMCLVFGVILLEGLVSFPRVVVELGDASYSLYISHGFVVAAGAIAWDRFIGAGDASSLLFALAMVAASWLVALEAHSRFERPATRYLNRRWASLVPPPARAQPG